VRGHHLLLNILFLCFSKAKKRALFGLIVDIMVKYEVKHGFLIKPAFDSK